MFWILFRRNKTLYITPFDHAFKIRVELPIIYIKKTALFTKPAFCKELKIDRFKVRLTKIYNDTQASTRGRLNGRKNSFDN